MTALLDALTELQLSAAACVLALRRVLLAGWVFRIEGLTVSSPGTEFGLASASRSELEDACTASGSSKLQRKLVRWYRMFGDSQPPPADRDPRTATEILRSVLSRYDLEIDSVKAMQRINGKVGGGLSANTGSVQEMYQVLVYRFEASDFEVLLEDPEFHAYLGRKVQDIAHGQTAKRLRRNADADGGGRL